MSVSNPQESPTPTSLREQIDRLGQILTELVNSNRSTPLKEQHIIGLGHAESLVTTYIEAAEIDARIETVNHILTLPVVVEEFTDAKPQSGVMTERILRHLSSLQAQKAVLEDKDA